MLDVQYKSAWFLAHRIREAKRSGDLATPFGSGSGAVEVDETYIGFKRDGASRGIDAKHAVLALLDRDTRTSRWFHVERTNADQVHPTVLANISREARVMTDEAPMYHKVSKRSTQDST